MGFHDRLMVERPVRWADAPWFVSDQQRNSTMKLRLLAAGLASALAMTSYATIAKADGDEESASPWSATLTVTSDYRFRGQSQNSRNFAAQGSIDFESASGFFAGVWASEIDFSDTADTDSFVEIDFYAGYNFSLSEQTTGSLKATYYLYPDNPFSYEYWEFQASLSHDFGALALSGEVNFSPDYFNETGDAIAIAAGVDVPLAETFLFFDGGLSASGHLGHQGIDDNVLFGTDDFTYWDIGLTAVWGKFTFDARYAGTDLNELECFGGTDLCESGFVGTISLTLP
jgi:uncharacterized protein (TIGR02001 family)